jgi:endoglucanase
MKGIHVALFLTALVASPPAHAADTHVRLNTVGFLPAGPKRATIAAPCDGFAVVRAADGVEVFSGKAGRAAANPDSGESLQTANFSALTTPGVYRLDVPGVGRSPEFRVAPDVYAGPLVAAMRAMYLWRCGTAVSATHGGHTFAHGPCHLHDASLRYVGGGDGRKDVTGGWHDAGDYNKYVVNAGFSLGVMLQAWEHFGPRLRGVTLDIPESSNDVPDFLDEVRWEVEWLLRMQADDGRVYHKVSTLKFGGFVMPEKETAERFLTPWSSAATADFVAVTAMAARVFKPYDKSFAGRCLDAARRSHQFLCANPENHKADLTGFQTGPYQANDASRRLWAAAEMWETTGEGTFLADFEKRLAATGRNADVQASWGNVKNLGVYTYLLSRRQGRDPATVEAARKDLLAAADEIFHTAGAHGYARPLGQRYFWGCNGDVAQQVQTLHVATVLSGNPAYKEAGLDALGHLFGRNVYGRSFVTGVGHNPPMHPHDRRSGADEVAEPWPGYLVGGGWPNATDWVDDQESYRTNEIAINWNAALIYALAAFLPEPEAPAPPGAHSAADAKKSLRGFANQRVSHRETRSDCRRPRRDALVARHGEFSTRPRGDFPV